MKAMTVKNVPDDLYMAIASLAKKNNRSMQRQVLEILDKARILLHESPTQRAGDIRNRLSGRDLGNTVEEIRKERSR